MMKTKVLFTFFIMILASQSYVYGQTEEKPKLAAQKDYMFHKEFVGGVRLASTGLNFYLQYGIIKNIYVTHLFTLEYEWHIDYRDKKTVATPYNTQSGRNYYFGVENRFHVIRLSYGFERALADKAAVKNGVRVSWVGFVGGALGLVKPYYLDIRYPGSTPDEPPVILSQRYSSANATEFLSQSSDPSQVNCIDQASPIWRGLDQMSPVIGGFGRTGLNFDFGSRDAIVKAIEAGVTLDVFYKKIPIYVNDDSNHFMFLGFYLAFHLGKRW
jgi:hypothetical protein